MLLAAHLLQLASTFLCVFLPFSSKNMAFRTKNDGAAKKYVVTVALLVDKGMVQEIFWLAYIK